LHPLSCKPVSAGTKARRVHFCAGSSPVFIPSPGMPMTPRTMTLLDLEATIRELPGVLGCVIVSDSGGEPSEVQAFTRVGTDRSGIQQAIVEEASRQGLVRSLRQVLVFELEAEGLMVGPDSLGQAELLAELEALDEHADAGDPARIRRVPAEPASVRPVLRRVVATMSSTSSSEAEVALMGRGTEVVGQAVGEPSGRGLEVVARATVDAVHKMIGNETAFSLQGTSLMELNGSEIVVALVGSRQGEMVGAALVRGGPHADAAVRAVLDALNRRLTRIQ
jgi:hypothetical protein